MQKISDISELEAIYGLASGPPVDKVTDHLTPSYAAWIAQSRFCVLSTVGPKGPMAAHGATQTQWFMCRIAKPCCCPIGAAINGSIPCATSCATGELA